MKYTALTSLMLVGSLMVLGGCGGGDDDGGGGGGDDDTTPPTTEEVTLEVQTWWKEGAELDAVNALKALHEKNHENVTVNVATNQNNQQMEDNVNNLIAAGNPPAAFQANLGGSALKWGAKLAALDAPWADELIPDTIKSLTNADGDIVGVPVALTRQNNIYYNVKVLDAESLTIPENLAQLKTLVDDLVAAGYEHPWCMGDKGNWVSAHFVFEGVAPAVMGKAKHIEYWSGQGQLDDPKMLEALELAVSWAPLFNTDFVSLDMFPGGDLVVEEAATKATQCVMTVMGDWQGSHMVDPGGLALKLDTDFAVRGFPAASGDPLFVFGGDAFVLPAGVDNEEDVQALFATIASEEGQAAFSEKKGSLPARIGMDTSSLGPVTRANAADLPNAVAGFKVINTAGTDFGPLGAAARNMMESGDTADVIDWLETNYGDIK